MPKFWLLCLILAEILLIQAMATDSKISELVEGKTGSSSHWVGDPPESVAPKPLETEETPRAAEAPEIRRLGKHHADKSVAGGGVIIGGLVTAIFAAVFCYIRVTRKREGADAFH